MLFGVIGLLIICFFIGGVVVLVLRALSIGALANVESWLTNQPIWFNWLIYTVIGYFVFMGVETTRTRSHR